jgi:FtsP/CotA-like multicopper oxidase with cupredoxin domain
LGIYDDYEDVSLTQNGTVRYYEFTVSAGTWNADGLNCLEAKLFNNVFPGPWIRACWGGQIHVTVNVDEKFSQGASLHAHGLRQWSTMHIDEVPGITRCPIAPNNSFEYVLNTTQYGSSWYHSHYSVQYPDGLLGPLVGHRVCNYDWYYQLRQFEQS